MSSTGCEPTAIALTRMLADESVQGALRALRGRHAPLQSYIDAIVSFSDGATAATIVDELEELPRTTAEMIFHAWELADGAGKAFRFASLPPSQPIAFARERKVRISVDIDDDGVQVSLSHIPGRHPNWSQRRQPVVAVAAGALVGGLA